MKFDLKEYREVAAGKVLTGLRKGTAEYAADREGAAFRGARNVHPLGLPESRLRVESLGRSVGLCVAGRRGSRVTDNVGVTYTMEGVAGWLR